MKKIVELKPQKAEEKKTSRRLTNAERDTVTQILVGYMLLPDYNNISEEKKKILTSAIDKIRAI